MRVIKRSAIVIRFGEPYLRWAAGIDEKAPEHAKSLRDAISVYLLPEDPAGEEESAPIDWCRDESLWPKRRDYAAFCQWFTVHATSVVTDLGSQPLEIEEL